MSSSTTPMQLMNTVSLIPSPPIMVKRRIGVDVHHLNLAMQFAQCQSPFPCKVLNCHQWQDFSGHVMHSGQPYRINISELILSTSTNLVVLSCTPGEARSKSSSLSSRSMSVDDDDYSAWVRFNIVLRTLRYSTRHWQLLWFIL